MTTELVLQNGTLLRTQTTDGNQYFRLNDIETDSGSRLDNYIASPITQRFFETLSHHPRFQGNEIIYAKSGNQGGTYAIEPIAHHYAQYVSPEYAVHVSILLTDLRTGQTEAIPSGSALDALKLTVQAMEEHQKQLNSQQQHLTIHDTRITNVETRLDVEMKHDMDMDRAISAEWKERQRVQEKVRSVVSRVKDIDDRVETIEELITDATGAISHFFATDLIKKYYPEMCHGKKKLWVLYKKEITRRASNFTRYVNNWGLLEGMEDQRVEKERGGSFAAAYTVEFFLKYYPQYWLSDTKGDGYCPRLADAS